MHTHHQCSTFTRRRAAIESSPRSDTFHLHTENNEVKLIWSQAGEVSESGDDSIFADGVVYASNYITAW